MGDRAGFTLPESMEAVVAAIGHSATLSIIHVWGGAEIWIPMPPQLDDSHPLVRFLGEIAALSLSRAIGGTVLCVPMGQTVVTQARDERIHQRWRSGLTIATIAREFSISQRAVYKTLARERARSRN